MSCTSGTPVDKYRVPSSQYRKNNSGVGRLVVPSWDEEIKTRIPSAEFEVSRCRLKSDGAAL